MARDRIYLIEEADLVTLVELALQTPVRTVAQQESLLATCTSLDNDFVAWTAAAIDTWEGRRCTCGRAIPVLVDNCADCQRWEARV